MCIVVWNFRATLRCFDVCKYKSRNKNSLCDIRLREIWFCIVFRINCQDGCPVEMCCFDFNVHFHNLRFNRKTDSFAMRDRWLRMRERFIDASLRHFVVQSILSRTKILRGFWCFFGRQISKLGKSSSILYMEIY